MALLLPGHYSERRTENEHQVLCQTGKNPTETLNLLKAVHGEQVMPRKQTLEWHMRFRNGHEDVGDNLKSGRPSTSKTEANIEKVKELIRSDRRLTIRIMTEQLGLDKETVRSILVDELGMQKVCQDGAPAVKRRSQDPASECLPRRARPDGKRHKTPGECYHWI